MPPLWIKYPQLGIFIQIENTPLKCNIGEKKPLLVSLHSGKWEENGTIPKNVTQILTRVYMRLILFVVGLVLVFTITKFFPAEEDAKDRLFMIWW